MNKQAGITLIEVLIALVVFAIGVGGMAALQLKSLGVSADASQRAVVMAKSQELADRIRSNQSAMTTYLQAAPLDESYCANLPPNCGDSNDGAALDCSNIELAQYDLWDVFCRARSGLTANAIEWQTNISCTSGSCDAALDTVTITTEWISKTADMDDVLADTADGPDDKTIDSLILSFIP